MTKRKFYKTVFEVTVLSEEPIGEPDLGDIDHMITEGDCSGAVRLVTQEELTGLQAAWALQGQASDPGFFNLTDKGEDADDGTNI